MEGYSKARKTLGYRVKRSKEIAEESDFSRVYEYK